MLSALATAAFFAAAGSSLALTPPPPADVLSPPSCHGDKSCESVFYSTLVQGDVSTWASNVSTDPFYQTPSNFSAYKPGELVRWQKLVTVQSDGSGGPGNSTWAVPETTSLSRFMFVSEDENGKPIPSTAFALLPYANPAGDGSPLKTIAWTRGTIGVQRQCAPSDRSDLWYSWQGPFNLATVGAVIGPDFSGLGTDIPGGFRYEAGALHATDTSNAIKAARAHLGNLITKVRHPPARKPEAASKRAEHAPID